ncbi:MAG: hypothetical protein H6732_14440 [Alphaproteobacteria bacterium]|nr:hypothetical protein [Alphaproteobacteria bacterium]
MFWTHARTATLGLLAAGCGSSLTGPGAVDGDTDALRTDSAAADPPDVVTYHRDVAPILREHCGSCHTPGGIAPFSLQTYDDASRWAEAILPAVLDRTMPPFDAREGEDCQPPLPWKDDLRLSEAELATLTTWVDEGTYEGARVVEPPPVAPDVIADSEADAILPIAAPFEVDGDEDIYACFRLEVPNDEKVWLEAVEVRPDNGAVVHHVLLWSDPDDQAADRAGEDGVYRCSGTPDFFPTDLIGGWVPGGAPIRMPEDTGILLKPGATIVMNVHYHPTGAGKEIDRSALAVKWTTSPPSHHATGFLVDVPFLGEVQPGPNDPGKTRFQIPPGVPDHTETLILDTGPIAEYLALLPLRIFSITPHMHYLGRAMKVTILRGDAPDDEEMCLVHTPEYRFDWQTTYTYDGDVDELPQILPGDRIKVECTYDNSPSNPYFGDALAASGATEAQTVRWGEETGDEMCMAMLGLVIPPVDLGALLKQFDLGL